MTRRKALLPQAVSTAGRVLLETSAVISVSSATPPSLATLSSFALLLPIGSVVAVDLASDKTDWRRRILTILLAIMLLPIGAPALTTVSADTLTCDKSKFITEGEGSKHMSLGQDPTIHISLRAVSITTDTPRILDTAGTHIPMRLVLGQMRHTTVVPGMC